MKLTFLGHSAFRIEAGGAVILIDPFLRGNGSFEASGMAWDDAVTGATHVVLSHGHDDHIGDTVEICKSQGAVLYATYELGAHLSSEGVETFEPMNTGGTVERDGIKVSLTDALHSSSSGGRYLGNPNGIVLRGEAMPTVYHMGDTDVFPGMAHVQDLYQPQVGIVPIGDRFTMGAEGAALACNTYFEFQTIVPCHYKTFPILAQSADDFVSAIGGSGIDVMEPGATITL
ncbi:MAG: metal-dependent hydrolase [Pseudomonadota bacterium]